jgi:hypothetical protein
MRSRSGGKPSATPALSLIGVVTALPARLTAVPLADLAPHWTVVVNLLAGSVIGDWLGATWATRIRSATLYRVLAALLVLIAAALAANHLGTITALDLTPSARIATGLVARVGIGAVAAVMGVAGGELLIPAVVLLHGIDIKLAGSLSLAVSLPRSARRPPQPSASRSAACRLGLRTICGQMI